MAVAAGAAGVAGVAGVAGFAVMATGCDQLVFGPTHARGTS